MSPELLHPRQNPAALSLGIIFTFFIITAFIIFLGYRLYKRRKRNKKKYRVADHTDNIPDPALERLAVGGNVISNGKVLECLDKDDCDTMTVTFSPCGNRLLTETNVDVDSDQC
jgi:hypothetical protein